MIRYKDFKKFAYRVKIQTLQNKGVHLATRRAHGCVIRLFAVHDFFVEIWSTQFLPWRNILHIRTFQNNSALDPYLEKVDVRGVLSA